MSQRGDSGKKMIVIAWMVGATKKMERGIWYERFVRMVWVPKSTLAPTIEPMESMA
jgi:hypothetical protein